MVAAMGGLIFGFDIGISGGVTSMGPFLKKFFPNVYEKQEEVVVSNYCKFDNHLLTAFTSSLYLAGMVASIFASLVTRNYGRRPSMLIGGVSFLVGAGISGSATNIYTLILGRLLLGVGVGFANQSVPLYISEIAPSKIRGAITNGFQLCVGLGVFSANLINVGTQKIKAGWGWRLSLSLAAVPAILFTAGALFLPETPTSLLQRRAPPSTVKPLLQKIRGTLDVDRELNDLASGTADAPTSSAFRLIFFRRRYRPHLVMAVLIPFFQQVTGINVIAFYAPVLFRTIGLKEGASLISTVVTGSIGIVATLASMVLVDRLGRRVLFITGGLLMTLPNAVIGAVLAAKLHDQGEMSRAGAYSVLILISVYILGFGWSWGPLGWLVPSEIFPVEVRSAGQSIVVVVSFFFTFVIAQTFLAMLCSFKAGTFFFFTWWILVMTAFVFWFLPETKNVPLEKMMGVWREHWFWKRIVGASEEVESGEKGKELEHFGAA
ncbi:Hexose carrier protein HEX6 [Platanthera zijinensis]|uniref:Hexose carrier protein HEX6 n=1 Tax=Platanthera zijinensis TaxID=2320716 RepID=A0AAP0BA76_9ASPA